MTLSTINKDNNMKKVTALKNEKNCKVDNNNKQKRTNYAQLPINIAKSNKIELIKYAHETDLISYIKTLFEAYKTIPNILKILDKIIEKRASTIMPSSYIYGNSPSSTYNEIDKVIDLTDRKNKLINIYVMVEKMLNSLNEQDRKVCILKYIKKTLISDIATELKTTERTIFRRCIKIIEKLSLFCLSNNWSSAFIKNQIKDEQWLFEILKTKIEKTNRSISKTKN